MQPGVKVFVNKLIDEYPALKHPDQQKRVVEKAEALKNAELARKQAIDAFVEHAVNKNGI